MSRKRAEYYRQFRKTKSYKDWYATYSIQSKDKRKLQRRLRYEKCKALTFAFYGAVCTCCGESNVGFLTIDHINCNGSQHRKQSRFNDGIYSWLIKNHYPPEFRVLCYNCNSGRAKYGGICPHQLVAEGKVVEPVGRGPTN